MKLLTFFNNSTKVYVIESEDFIKPNSIYLEDILKTLSESELEKYNKFKNLEAKFTYLTSRFYLRNLLNKRIATAFTKPRSDGFHIISDVETLVNNEPNYDLINNYSLHNQKIRIETTSSGKPFLVDYPNLYFNISHTKGLILIGFAPFPIGVDVELIERNADIEAILKHFFSKKEQKSYFSQPDDLKQLSFYTGWTRKESFLKATGEGLVKMNDVEVSFEPETEKPILVAKTTNFKIKNFTPKIGYISSVTIITD